MNYEEFYKEVSDSAKAAETAAGNAHKSAKKVTAALAGGDLKNESTNTSELTTALNQYEDGAKFRSKSPLFSW